MRWLFTNDGGDDDEYAGGDVKIDILMTAMSIMSCHIQIIVTKANDPNHILKDIIMTMW